MLLEPARADVCGCRVPDAGRAPAVAPEPGAAGLLTDGFGRRITDLRISVTDRCNLRCTYCMPEQGVHLLERERLLRIAEIVRVVRIAVGLGVRKIRLTGGEPLLRRDLPGLVATLAEIPGLDNLAMTTNGVLLARYARGLHASGLRHLNVSLDTLRQTRFAAITRTRSLDQVLAGIAAAQRAGFHPVKINMIPMRGCNDDEILPMARWAVAQGLHLRFIEFMPFCGNGWTPERVVSAADIRDTLARELPLGEGRRETPHAPALDYPVGSSGAVLGIIAPMTQPFCQGCSRMRLTAEGVLRPCLHADVEVSIGAALRAGADDGTLASVFRAAAAAKPAGRSQPARPAPSLRPMVRIGG